MKQLFACLVVASAALLAACGGGGSTGGNPIPNPQQSNPPTTTYSAQLRFVGALAGHTIQSDLRRAQEARTPLDAGVATPIPIMVISAPEAKAIVNAVGYVQAVVSPFPSAAPNVTFTQTNPNAQIVPTPSPAPSSTPQPLPSGVIAQQYAQSTGIQTQSAGTVSATIGSPVNAQPTTPIYSYMSIALDCYSPGDIAGGTSAGYAAHSGWQWTGSTWAPDDDISTADIYIDGPNCVAKNPSESEATIHVPGGETRLSTDTPFTSVTVSQWANSETSFTTTQALAQNPDYSTNALVVGKTRDGARIFKLCPFAVEYNDGYFGAIEVSGDSVDGF